MKIAEATIIIAKIEEARAVKDGICTGYYNEAGQIVHDGDTCPIHESK